MDYLPVRDYPFGHLVTELSATIFTGRIKKSNETYHSLSQNGDKWKIIIPKSA